MPLPVNSGPAAPARLTPAHGWPVCHVLCPPRHSPSHLLLRG